MFDSEVCSTVLRFLRQKQWINYEKRKSDEHTSLSNMPHPFYFTTNLFPQDLYSI
jgi:hypothetical protein